jgi:hypothetical protein
MVKPDIDSIEIHPQLSHKGHPVDGVLLGSYSFWPLAMSFPSLKASPSFKSGTNSLEAPLMRVS